MPASPLSQARIWTKNRAAQQLVYARQGQKNQFAWYQGKVKEQRRTIRSRIPREAR